MAVDVRPFGELFAAGTRNGLTRPKAVRGAGVKMVNMGELFAYPRLRNAPMDRVPLSAAEANRFLLEPGDLLFARQSLVLEGAGKCSIFLEDDELVTFESHITRVRLDPQKADPRFYFYYLQSHHGRAAITSIVEQGAGASGIRGSDLEKLSVLWRPISVQREIADRLGALDDKIEQNRRTAQALEQLARAIFRAWFVDFEPMKAKAAGATAFPSMPQSVFDALPTEFVGSGIGAAAEGSSECLYTVSDLENRGWLQVGDGYRAKRSELAAIGLPFIRAGDVNGTVEADSAELIGADSIAKVGTKRSRAWDTVFTSKGSVGRFGLVTPSTGSVVYSPQVCFWRSLDTQVMNPFFLHLWLRSDSFKSQWMAVKGETDMADFVSLSDQRAMCMQLPAPRLQAAFASIVEPLFRLRACLDSESKSLAVMRDYMLPKLLSGKVHIRPSALEEAM